MYLHMPSISVVNSRSLFSQSVATRLTLRFKPTLMESYYTITEEDMEDLEIRRSYEGHLEDLARAYSGSQTHVGSMDGVSYSVDW